LRRRRRRRKHPGLPMLAFPPSGWNFCFCLSAFIPIPRALAFASYLRTASLAIR